MRLNEQNPTTAETSLGTGMLASFGLGGGRMRRRLATGVGVAAIVLTVLSAAVRSEADSRGTIPTYAVRVAGGSIKRGHWGIWVFGRRGVGQCWGTRTVVRGLPNETAFCGYDVPKQALQLAVRGTLSTNGGSKSLLFYLTRPDVALLEVLIDRPGGRRVMLHIHAHAIGRDQARGAHMQPTFGIAVATVSGRISCIRHAVAWTQSGVRVGAARSAHCS
jgi:hypothetical protein